MRATELFVMMMTACGTGKGSTTTAASTSPADEAGSPATGVALDLSAHGLPLRLAAPACVKVQRPPVQVADNAKDLMLMCEPGSGLDAAPAFAIQVGPAARKLGAEQIQQDLSFVRFTRRDPDHLAWEVKLFGQTASDFMVRKQIGGAAYACFPVFAGNDEALLAQELAACESLAAK